MRTSARESPNKPWDKTNVQNLVRHKSGRYYARAFCNNKEIWKGPGTSYLQVGKARLAEFLHEDREKRAAATNVSSAKMTFGEELAIHLQNLNDNVTIKPGTRHYWRQMRHFFDLAFDAGIVYGNPAAKLKRVTVRAKRTTLSESGQISATCRGSGARRRMVLARLRRFSARFGVQPGVARTKRARYAGAIWILQREKSLCEAML
jgi:hypothetical protein